MSTRDHSPKRTYRTRLVGRVEPAPEVRVIGPRTKAGLYNLIVGVLHVGDPGYYGIKHGEFITQNSKYGMTLQQCADRIVHEIWSRRNATLLEFPYPIIVLASSLLYIAEEAGYGLFLSIFNATEVWKTPDWAYLLALAVTSSNNTREKPLRRALLRLAERFSVKLPRERLLREFGDFDLDIELNKPSTTKSGIKVAYEQTRVIESTYGDLWKLGFRSVDVRQAAHELELDIGCAKDILLPALIVALNAQTVDFWQAFIKSARAVHEKTPFDVAEVAGAVTAYNNLPYRTYNLDTEFTALFMRDMTDEVLKVPSHLFRRTCTALPDNRLFTLADSDE